MRALLLALLLVAPLAPLALAQTGGIVVTPDSTGTIRLDTSHLSARLRFDVTNTGTELDYVTIPRQLIKWTDTGQASLGFPSPEFGRTLAPGETAPMWAHVDVGEPRVGTRTVEIAFQSERTGQVVARLQRTIEVVAAPAPAHQLRVQVQPAGARVEILDLTGVAQPEVRAAPEPGGASAMVTPGRYAIRADLEGHQGATRIVNVTGATRVDLTLSPARWSATAHDLTSASAGDSAWLLGGSRDLRRLVTAPMVHQQSSPGKFVGLQDGGIAWNVTFPTTAFPQTEAGPFQALDTIAAVSPDGSRAAGFDWNGRVHVIDFATGATLWTSDRAADRNPHYPSASDFGRGFFTSGALAFSNDGATLVAAGSNGWTVAFDAASGSVRWSRAFSAEVRALRYTPDGTGVLVGSGEWKIHRVDAATGSLVWSADDPEFWPFFFIATSADGSLLAAGGKDSVYRVWNATDGSLVRSFDVFPAFVTGGGIGPWGGTFSDWGVGARGFDAAGETTWLRRFKGANLATTDDGRFTLVGWADEGAQRSGLVLLDETGTTLWASDPSLPDACTSTVSPFPARQIKSVLLASESSTSLRFAAACIGGGVFSGRLEIAALAPSPSPSPAPSPSPSPSSPPPPPAAPPTGPPPSPPATSGGDPTPTAGTPLPAIVALGALAIAARRRRG